MINKSSQWRGLFQCLFEINVFTLFKFLYLIEITEPECNPRNKGLMMQVSENLSLKKKSRINTVKNILLASEVKKVR